MGGRRLGRHREVDGRRGWGAIRIAGSTEDRIEPFRKAASEGLIRGPNRASHIEQGKDNCGSQKFGGFSLRVSELDLDISK